MMAIFKHRIYNQPFDVFVLILMEIESSVAFETARRSRSQCMDTVGLTGWSFSSGLQSRVFTFFLFS